MNRDFQFCDDSCPNFIYIGGGDAICDRSPSQLVMEDWTPTENFLMCHAGICGKKKEPPCTTRNGSKETSYAQSIQTQRAFVKLSEAGAHGQ